MEQLSIISSLPAWVSKLDFTFNVLKWHWSKMLINIKCMLLALQEGQISNVPMCRHRNDKCITWLVIKFNLKLMSHLYCDKATHPQLWSGDIYSSLSNLYLTGYFKKSVGKSNTVFILMAWVSRSRWKETLTQNRPSLNAHLWHKTYFSFHFNSQTWGLQILGM